MNNAKPGGGQVDIDIYQNTFTSTLLLSLVVGFPLIAIFVVSLFINLNAFQISLFLGFMVIWFVILYYRILWQRRAAGG